MCIPAPRPSKATHRPSTPSSPQQKSAKHLKTCHPNADLEACANAVAVATAANTTTTTTATTNHKSILQHKTTKKVPKSVSFNEVVMIRPHFFRQPPQQPIKKKSVSFCEVVIVRPVLHLTDFTDQEIIDSWYILADKQRIKSEILSTLRRYKEEQKLMNNSSNNDSFSSLLSSSSDSSSSSSSNTTIEYCTRGLEKLSDGGRARERRRISIREIIQEQESQRALYAETKECCDGCERRTFVYDTTKFRKTYKPYSRAARHVAHAVAKMDELEAASENESV